MLHVLDQVEGSSTSSGALLCNLTKVLLDRSKASQAAQKRDYSDKDKFVHASIRM